MLKYIRFNNFYSFLDETEISFVVGKQPSQSNYDIKFDIANSKDKTRLNKVIAVIGANASGKTQLLKILAFLHWFLTRSMESTAHEKILFETFALNQDDECHIEMGFFIPSENDIYQEYRYEVTFSKGLVKQESLYHKTSSNFSYIFERSYQDDKLLYKHKGFIKPSIADDVRSNVSMVAFGTFIDNEIANNIFIFVRLMTANLGSNGRVQAVDSQISEFAENLRSNLELKQQTENLLCQFDTGIQEITFKKILARYENHAQEEILMPFGVHYCGDRKFEKIFFEESNGTQSAFVLLSRVLPILSFGGVAIIDEIDNDLHPLLLPVILDLFKFKETNPHNAQLIFSCHTPEVLNHLQKHQVYLVQKDNQQSEAWRLDEVVGVRSDDNLYAKYMSGAFEAIPRV